MDGLRAFLEEIRQNGTATGHFLGLLHILIGRRVTTRGGDLVSQGVTWRVLADELRRVRWDRDAVRELGIEPATLAPRDRERYWYQAIALARVDSPEARQAADRFSKVLRAAGYLVE